MPLELGPREWVVDAQAAFLNPHEVRLAEVTVLTLEDRSVRLRFTVGGWPSPAARPASCPRGQALVFSTCERGDLPSARVNTAARLKAL